MEEADSPPPKEAQPGAGKGPRVKVVEFRMWNDLERRGAQVCRSAD